MRWAPPGTRRTVAVGREWAHDGRMTRSHALVALGVLLVLVGALWTLQGLNYVGGSVMSGNTVWAVVGPVVLVVGVLVAARGWKGRAAPRP